MRDALAITKALADANRLRILCALRRGELCVCQIIELLGLAGSTVSKHLSILYQARLVEARKDGRWMHYRLPDGRGEASSVVREALSWVRRALGEDPVVIEDARRLDSILSVSPEVLCQRQAGNSACCSSARGTRVAARWRKGGRGR